MKIKENKKFDLFRIIFSLIVIIPLIIVHYLYGDNEIWISTVNYVILLPIALICYLLLIYDLFLKTLRNFKKKRFFDEITLTLIASLVAFIVGEFIEGLAVVLFFQIGEKFEEYAVNKSRQSITEVLNLRADKATLFIDGKEKDVDPYDVNVDDIIIVKNGEKVPLDGIVYEGSSFIDTSSLTGESVPRKVKEGNEILSGVINKGSPLLIKVSKPCYESTVSKIMDIVENATNTKTEKEKFITKFSKYYTPTVLLLALIYALIPPLIIGLINNTIGEWTLWSSYIYNAASLLVVSCPCALVLSVPMAYFVGLGEASKIRMLIKGSIYLEELSKLDTVILDKTGTITKGNFVLTNIYNEENIDKEYILSLARIAEYNSLHPIALSILGENKESQNIDIINFKDSETIEGKGIKGLYKDKLLLVGNHKLMEEFNIPYKKNNEIGTIVYVSYDNKFLGSLLIKDEIKEDSYKAIKEFKKVGIKNIYMLTGDNYETATYVANEVGIKNIKSNLLPLDKVDEVKKIINDKEKVKVSAFIGDGVNDAPSMSLVDIGISMGNIGSDAAIVASDIVLMEDKLSSISKGKAIAKRTLRVVIENIVFALLIKLIAIILALSNLIEAYIMWIAIFADVGVTFICVCNSLRLMIKKKEK